MERIREEFEKQENIVREGYLKEGVALSENNLIRKKWFYLGYKSRDEEINKLKSIAEEYQESYVQIERENKGLRDALESLIPRFNYLLSISDNEGGYDFGLSVCILEIQAKIEALKDSE